MKSAIDRLRELARPRGSLIQAVCERTLERHPELNFKGLAALLGMPESSTDNYRKGKTSLPVDRAAAICRRPLTPPDFVQDLCQAIGGPRVAVTSVDPVTVPAGTSPDDVEQELLSALSELSTTIHEAVKRRRDGAICADDAAAISFHISKVEHALRRAAAFSQHCAGRSR